MILFSNNFQIHYEENPTITVRVYADYERNVKLVKFGKLSF